MTGRLKRIQSMAQRYHSLGVVKDDTMESIKVTVATHRIPAVPLIERQVLGLVQLSAPVQEFPAYRVNTPLLSD